MNRALQSAGCVIALAMSACVHAQAYPAKPVRIVIGLGAGGPPDIATRTIAPRMGEGLGQAVLVENRPGAGGAIAMDLVAKSAPDGYTLTLGTTGTMLLAKALIAAATWDPIASFAPIGLFAKTHFVLVVNPRVPANSLKELMALAKSQPGKLNYGASTPGTPPHILAEMFKSQAGVDIFGVNYKSSPESVQALLAGDVQMLVDAPVAVLPLVAAGKVRPLVVTSATRNPRLPEVPTAVEAGMPGFSVDSWFGLVAPAGTPDPVVRRLHAELAKAAAQPEVTGAFTKMGLDTGTSTPEAMAAVVKTDFPKWAAAVKASGAKLQ